MRKLLFPLLLVAATSQVGCIKALLTKGQISATRSASSSFQTIGDYELARSAASAGLVQFEGMHRLAPDNEDALFLLLRGWAGYAYAFAIDDYEAAQDAGDDELAEYHRKRARMALDRGIGYGKELLGKEDGGFENAKRNDATFKAWINEHFSDKEDAEEIYWFGASWLLRVQLMADTPEYVADLFVGVALLEHARKLDPALEHWGSTANLAAYHARSGMAEVDQAKAMFEEALAKTERKTLMIQFNYAARYACLKNDRGMYEKLLHEVLEAEDPDPDQRLANAVAKRRAKRYLGKTRMMDCGFDMSAPSASGSGSAPGGAPEPPPEPVATTAPAAEAITADQLKCLQGTKTQADAQKCIPKLTQTSGLTAAQARCLQGAKALPDAEKCLAAAAGKPDAGAPPAAGKADAGAAAPRAPAAGKSDAGAAAPK